MKGLRALAKVLRSRWWSAYVIALAAVALTTVALSLGVLHLYSANFAMVFLIIVLIIAFSFGSGAAILTALSAFAGLDWFFMSPKLLFVFGAEDEAVILLAFLATAIVTGQLAAGQRRREEEIRQRQRGAAVLYDVARLMSEPDLEKALKAVANRLREELHLEAVILEVADESLSARATSGFPPHLSLADAVATLSATRNAGESGRLLSFISGDPRRWIRIVPVHRQTGNDHRADDSLHIVPLRAGERRLGVMQLFGAHDAAAFRPADDRLLSTVAVQLGQLVERARLQRELTEAEISRRSDELKTALLNAVSHDMRTPLASIIASAGSLLQDDVGWTDDERRDFAQAITAEAERLNRIVENLLDLSRIEAGSLRPQRSWYDVTTLVDDVLSRLRTLTSHHHVLVDIPEDLPPVYVDYIEIDQVLSNIIENATKYAPAGTDIVVIARQHGDEVRVEVTDRGPGIPPAALPHLFEPFYRLEGQRRRPRGTGLGLAVAKGLVQAHGGRIWAENRTDGGACFVFTLAPTASEPVAANSMEEAS